MSISIQTAYKAEIKLPYGELGSVVDWCKKNCQSPWQFQETASFIDAWAPEYTFYFESERDYVAFTIWKK